MRLEGKVALITGADGPLGTATALRFAREGVLPAMRERCSGRVLSVSSTGSLGVVGHVSAEASHAGLIALTKTLALEAAPHGLYVDGGLSVVA